MPAVATESSRIRRVLAGPGSGKTRLLTQELAVQLDKGLPPDTLLGVTFTRRAADELTRRLRAGRSETPWVGTFHQLARRIQVDVKQLPAQIDLDRLIPDATALLERGTFPKWVTTIRFIGVDEAQDLDATQAAFLQALLTLSAQAELLLVGDPDQAIYGFRRASATYLLDPEAYFRTPVRTVILSENHRSAKDIVATAQAILAHAAHPDSPSRRLTAIRPEAHPAVRVITGTSAADEARRIFQEVRTLLAVGVPGHEQAILVRTRAQFAALKEEAARWRIELHTPPTDERLAAHSKPQPRDAVALLTMHQAKGCEWTVVFLAGCQAGLLPHTAARTPQEIDEERRLLYVAVTRAKQLLWFCRHGAPSPFLTRLHTSTASSAPRPSGSATAAQARSIRSSFWKTITSLLFRNRSGSHDPS